MMSPSWGLATGVACGFGFTAWAAASCLVCAAAGTVIASVELPMSNAATARMLTPNVVVAGSLCPKSARWRKYVAVQQRRFAFRVWRYCYRYRTVTARMEATPAVAPRANLDQQESDA